MPAASIGLERVQRELARRAAVSASDLAEALSISVPTVHRLLKKLPEGLHVTAGNARRTRHALLRPSRGSVKSFPTYSVDTLGQLQTGPVLKPVQPEGHWMDLAGTVWPIPDEARDGWWPGLPYPLQHIWPDGYMGRQLARAESVRRQIPVDPRQWSDEDLLLAVSEIGTDLSGDLIVGEEAAANWLATRVSGFPAEDTGTFEATVLRYSQLAQIAVDTGAGGTSVAGEFPKFTTTRNLAGAATGHVIVKFSGADSSAAVRRWSDLLVCEHLALRHAASMNGIQVAATRLLQGAGRTFLEVERFDRHGEAGRSPLVGLDVLNHAFIGSAAAKWPVLVAELDKLALLRPDVLAQTQRLWWYGQLIANSDMHAGNLSFVPEERLFRLAPVYDMLPMRHAPLPGGEVPTRAPEFSLPLPAQRAAWQEACAAAWAFWREAAADTRISDGFRQTCGDHAAALERLQARA